MLGAIAGCGIVLEILNKRARLRALVQDLGFAFIDSAPTVHGRVRFIDEGRYEFGRFMRQNAATLQAFSADLLTERCKSARFRGGVVNPRA
jgi:hypothetical protein